MSSTMTESTLVGEQLRRRIDRLAEENRTLRDLASPSAGPLELQAENILLQREVADLTDLIPTLVPYSGPLPTTLAELAALPAAHVGQIAREHPDHLSALRQVEQLLDAAAEADLQSPADSSPADLAYL